jgi:hypothetical protein
MKKIIILSFLLAFTLTNIFAQDKPVYNPKEYSKKPIWIKMMKDPEVNFYEAIKAFRKFWKEKKLPCEAGEEEGMDAFEVEVGLRDPNKPESKRERKRESKNDKDSKKYAYEVKQFRGWLQQVKPWLQQDGTIMRAEDQQKLIDKQQNELKEIEKQNKQ